MFCILVEENPLMPLLYKIHISMKKYLLGMTVSFIVACTGGVTPVCVSEDDAYIYPLTKSEITDSYYWYKGKKVPLTQNLEYVNIVISESRSIDKQLKKRVSDLGLVTESVNLTECVIKAKLESSRTNDKDYCSLVHELKANISAVVAVCPFYERGKGMEPIGTSDIFYVRLKGDDQYGLPVELQKYDTAPLLELCEMYGVQIIKEIPYMPDWYMLSIAGSDFENSIDAANRFYESNLVADVDPAFMFDFRPNSVNDPMFGQQWGLSNSTNPDYDINIEGAWAITKGYGAKIAILDEGVDDSHNDLLPNFSSLSYDAQSQSIPSIYVWGRNHGTHVAGIMTAKGNNGLQIAGIAYDAQLIRVSNNSGITRTFSSEMASGISWARTMGADVFNCSWGDQGGYFNAELHSTILETSIDYALRYGRNNKGAVVVFAAGNWGMNGAVMDYPATCDDRILAVGSINNMGMRSFSSGYGSKLDVVAPGENILSTMPDNSTGSLSGTSMAAPFVSGIAALMISANPDITRETVVRVIEQTARKISPNDVYTYYPYPNRYNGNMNVEVGYGLVDATMAVTVARDAGLSAPASSPRLDCLVTEGYVGVYDSWFVMGWHEEATATFSLKNAQINPAYSYYWHFSTSGDTNWNPSFDFVGSSSGVIVNIPRPSVDSVINMKCEVYDGYTHICTATFPLTVRLNHP